MPDLDKVSMLRRFHYDDETGEVITYHVNEETGEPQSGSCRPMYKRPLKMRKLESKSYLKQSQQLRYNIASGYNFVSFRLFLIPTLLIFPGLLSILIPIIEIYLHLICHKKNKTLEDPTMYYQSPFHIVTSVFCGICREDDMTCKIGQLQDIRKSKYKYFKGLV